MVSIRTLSNHSSSPPPDSDTSLRVKTLEDKHKSNS